VRILVGFAAGGNFDTIARLIGQWLSEQLHQPVIVENRPGASSNIATEAVVRAPADGYTLLLGGAVNTVNATLYDKLGFNFVRDVAPVAGVVRFPNVMMVNASFPTMTIPEFIAYAKANPGMINHGSSGNGTTQHLAGELFKMMTGVNFVHVPYRGASQALTDLLSGQVQVLFEPLPASIGHIKSGALRALAMTTATRSEALPVAKLGCERERLFQVFDNLAAFLRRVFHCDWHLRLDTSSSPPARSPRRPAFVHQ
jgi:tripartite-type tricarboxylate transporter receptor subunit TctC